MKNYEQMAQSVFEKKEEYIKKRSKNRKKAIFAICITLVCGVALTSGAIFLNKNGGGVTVGDTPTKTENDRSNEKYPELYELPKKIISTEGTSEEYQEMMAVVTKWEERTITGQYSEAEYNGVSYSGKSKTVAKTVVGEALGVITAKGLDDYTSTLHKKQVVAYEINKISKNCAIAVQFGGDNNYYIYTNPFYSPETLGDFINDLSLEEFLTVGMVDYDNSTGMGDSYVHERIEFTGLEADAVWDILLCDTALKNVYSDLDWFVHKMSISISIPYLGYNNISISLTEDGYLLTNILDTEKAFFIGSDRVDQFTRHMINNCEGLRIIYEPDDNQEDSKKTNGYAESTSSQSVSSTVEHSILTP